MGTHQSPKSPRATPCKFSEVTAQLTEVRYLLNTVFCQYLNKHSVNAEIIQQTAEHLTSYLGVRLTLIENMESYQSGMKGTLIFRHINQSIVRYSSFCPILLKVTHTMLCYLAGQMFRCFQMLDSESQAHKLGTVLKIQFQFQMNSFRLQCQF